MGKMPPLIRTAKLLYGYPYLALNHIRLENQAGADLKAEPYLYVINHVGIYDPVMVSAIMPRHIRWVAGAYLFKNAFLKKVIGDGCTAIPKQQGRSDLSMVRNMLKALRDGENVGIFPEGTRTWDGEMMPLDYKPLAKMIRMFKFPVLFVHLEGGYAHQPRWADYKRKGPITINVKYQLTAEQIASMDLETLQNTVQQYLHFSNDEWKRTVDYNFRSPKRAEGVQRLLYMCPECKALDTITARGNRIVCSKCNTVSILDDKDDLTSLDVPFKTLSQWHRWEASQIGAVSSFPPEKGVLLLTGDFNNEGVFTEISKDITVQMHDQTLFVDCNDVDYHLALKLSEISSLILNNKQTIELFCNEVLYRIRLMPQASSLKYHEYYLDYINHKEDK